MLPEEELRARIRAARKLAGLTRRELADKMAIKGLSEKTLGAIERGERPVRSHEIQPMAEAMDISTSFFEVAHFAEPEDDDELDQLDRLERKLDLLHAKVDVLLQGLGATVDTDQPWDPAMAIADITRLLVGQADTADERAQDERDSTARPGAGKATTATRAPRTRRAG